VQPLHERLMARGLVRSAGGKRHSSAKSWAQAIGTRFGLLLLMLGFALQLAAVLRGS
jgi:hypothetical protein